MLGKAEVEIGFGRKPLQAFPELYDPGQTQDVVLTSLPLLDPSLLQRLKDLLENFMFPNRLVKPSMLLSRVFTERKRNSNNEREDTRSMGLECAEEKESHALFLVET